MYNMYVVYCIIISIFRTLYQLFISYLVCVVVLHLMVNITVKQNVTDETVFIL